MKVTNFQKLIKLFCMLTVNIWKRFLQITITKPQHTAITKIVLTAESKLCSQFLTLTVVYLRIFIYLLYLLLFLLYDLFFTLPLLLIANIINAFKYKIMRLWRPKRSLLKFLLNLNNKIDIHVHTSLAKLIKMKMSHVHSINLYSYL